MGGLEFESSYKSAQERLKVATTTGPYRGCFGFMICALAVSLSDVWFHNFYRAVFIAFFIPACASIMFAHSSWQRRCIANAIDSPSERPGFPWIDVLNLVSQLFLTILFLMYRFWTRQDLYIEGYMA